ncbi:MAG TPA: c-type cytochrome [candidate division Zixibacteria bacterium]|nr:c-type cytochrome [candidate division Zixibacteria bacterium]
MKTKAMAIALGMGIAVGWAVPALAADAGGGKALFEKSCASCHGKDGKGNPAMAKVLGEKGLNITTKETKQKSDKELTKIIIEGSGKMPATKGLSEKDVKEVLSHVRSLAK